MSLLLLLLSLSFLPVPPARLTVIDMNLAQPPREETDFTVASYFKRKFPINSADVQSVAAAAEKAAKLLDSKKVFTTDTLLNGGTTFIICANNDEFKTVTVKLITAVKASSASFGFELLRREADRRKAQRRLVDFIAYLQ